MQSKRFYFSLLIVVLIPMIVVLTGCRKPNPFYDKDSIQREDVSVSRFKTFSNPESQIGFSEFSFANVSFGYPENWRIKQVLNEETVVSVELLNTDREICRGSVCPRDFYRADEPELVINSDKYAETYSLLTADVCRTDLDWLDFFRWKYADIITNFSEEDLVNSNGVAMVLAEPIAVEGLLGGDERFFLRIGAQVWDFSLQVRGEELAQLEAIFRQLVESIKVSP